MSNSLKFPSSVEIKRVIAAAVRAGIEVGSIEIHPTKIIINPREKNEPQLSEYDLWKLSEGRSTSRARRIDKQSGAQRGKSGT
jgi:hypothetical protein